MTEIEQPLTVRRTVAFSEAVRVGKSQVEGATAVRAQDVSHALGLLSGEGVVPVLVDPACACVKDVASDAVVDAVLAKRNLGTTMDMAPIVVGVGRASPRAWIAMPWWKSCAGIPWAARITRGRRCRTPRSPALWAALRVACLRPSFM